MSPRRGICAEVNGHGGKWLLFIFTCYVKNGETTTEYEAAKPEYRLFACGVLSLLEDVFVLSDAHKNQVAPLSLVNQKPIALSSNVAFAATLPFSFKQMRTIACGQRLMSAQQLYGRIELLHALGCLLLLLAFQIFNESR